MESTLQLMAATEAATPGIAESLGIDWRLLIVQSIAFLILLGVLSKFVYPVLSSMLDKREATIREGIKAAQEAEHKADAAKAEVDEMLEHARKQARELLATAKSEAESVVETASVSAAERTDRMIAEAHAQIEQDVASAQKALRDETLNLVALATEKVIGKTVTPDVDKKVIASAIKEVE